MAYWRTILKGSIGTTEVWSVGTNWGIVGLAPDVPNQTAADGILAKLIAYTTSANMPAALRSAQGVGVWVDAWRVELRGEDERILSVAEGLVTSSFQGTGAASKTPQDALVLSLRTNTPGARGRGRMYWPAIGASLDAAFKLSSPTPAAFAADFKTWLNAIGSQMNAYYIGVSSALRVALSVRSVTDHVNRDVVSLQVGNILDTQRRRRDVIPETYVAVAYP